jgi:hypothetical protein
MRALCCLLLLVGTAALPARAASPPKTPAGILDSTLKPTPANPGPFKSSVTLWSAKNEFELFHVVLFGGNRGITINLPTLVQVGGSLQIPADALRIYEEQPISFTQPSGIEGRSGAWPDALVPYGPTTDVGLRLADGAWQEVQTTETRRNFPITTARNSTRTFLVEIHVPPGTATGLYRGTLVVTATAGRGTVSQSIPVDLHVRSFTLPSTSSLRSNLKLAVDEICRAHGDVIGSFCPDQAGFRRWARLYGRFLLDHRLSSWLSDALYLRADGSPDYPTSQASFLAAYRSLIDGSDTYSHLAGARLTAIAYPYLRATDTDGVIVDKLQAWAAFARAQGDWFDRTVFYTQDEPDFQAGGWDRAIHWATLAHTADPAFKVLLTAPIDSYASHAGAASGVANIIAPVIDHLDNRAGTTHYGNQRPSYDGFLAFDTRNELWSYQSCDSHSCGSTSDPTVYGWPSLVVDATAVQARAEPWMHYIYRVTGLHYFDSVLHLQEAWTTNGMTDLTGNGDGTLLYPGTPTAIPGGSSQGIGGSTHVPLASTRLKALRDGLEDYEYLKMCEAIGGGTTAMNVARALFPMQSVPGAGPANETGSMYSATTWNPTTRTDDPTVLAAALAARREDLARCIGGSADAAPP